MKNILAISGSLRTGSSNHAILRFIGGLAPENFGYTIYDGLSRLPHFDPDLDNDQPPETVIAFRKIIREADGIVICSPEYAYGVPGTLKNALDWTVSSGSFVGKPLLLITASTGGQSAHAAMLLILGALSANVLKNASMLISFIRSKMDADGKITDEATAENLKEAFEVLLNVVGS